MKKTDLIDTKAAKDLGYKLVNLASDIEALEIVKKQIVKPTVTINVEIDSTSKPLECFTDKSMVEDVKQYIMAQTSNRIDTLTKQLKELMP